jgi:hypothetical protein
MALLARLRAALADRRFPVLLAVAAVLLSLPSVGTGFVLDDYVLRAVALGRGPEVGVPGSRFDLFTFFSDAPGERLRGMDTGWAPWWSGADLRLHFFRPLSSLSHWLDFQIWPSSPLPMHLENVAIYAALALAVAVFYRRVLGPTWIAGLAAVLYAIDPGHAQSSGVIAGRNTMLAPLFGVLSLIMHDRARRDGYRPGALLSAALFGAGLLAGESGVSTGAYLLAYAICLDPEAAWARRLRALAPHALVGVAWLVAYKLLHHGARGSGMYVDPGHDPLVYLQGVVVRGPIFLAGQLGLPLASVFSAMSARAVLGLAAGGALFCAILSRLAWPSLREDPASRFLALGMLLSVLPVCAIIEVREVTPEGRPVEVRFTFDEPLDSPSLRWLVWDRGRYVDLALPAIGQTVKLAPVGMMPG